MSTLRGGCPLRVRVAKGEILPKAGLFLERASISPPHAPPLRQRMRLIALVNLRLLLVRRFACAGPVKETTLEESRTKWAARVYSCTVVVSDGEVSSAVQP